MPTPSRHAQQTPDLVVETLTVPEPASLAPPRGTTTTESLPGSFQERYQRGETIARGGMGLIERCRDVSLERGIVVKKILPELRTSRTTRARFLREARVQGALQHPGIVPVYDVGTNDAGELYFTMRHVTGTTLAHVIDGLRRGDDSVRQRFTQRDLLARFGLACLTVHYANEHGVVHRDLKPDNVMLGEYGEVYVLDWGIAKLVGETDAGEWKPRAPGEKGPILTPVFTALGTPEYMAPEQAGPSAVVDARADVFALGAILFELLTLKPFRPGDRREVSRAIRKDSQAGRRLSEADLGSPELIALCARATEVDPAKRLQTAQELHRGIARYLEGERDSERRHELAREHTRKGREHLQAYAESGDVVARERGMSELGRALALDPDDRDAVDAVIETVLDETDELAPEATQELRVEARQVAVSAARSSFWLYAIWLSMFPVAMLLGVRSYAALAAMAAPIVALLVCNAWVGLRGVHSRALTFTMAGLSFAAVAGLSGFVGPFMLVPSVAVATAAAFMITAPSDRALRWTVGILAFCTVVVPGALQQLGVLPASYVFRDGSIVVLPAAVHLTPTFTPTLLLVGAGLIVLLCTGLVGRAAAALAHGKRQTVARAARLRSFLPPEAKRALARQALGPSRPRRPSTGKHAHAASPPRSAN